jgi:V8-like Glu-specific endopeptidase
MSPGVCRSGTAWKREAASYGPALFLCGGSRHKQRKEIMTDLFNDDIFAIADGVEQIDLTSGGPWRAIVRRITRSEQAETGLTDDTVVFMIEPAAVVNIGDTVTRPDESTYTIVKAQLRSHDSRWVAYTVSGTPSSPPAAEPTQLLSIAIASANTEYSLHLGTTKSFSINCRNAISNLRIALQSGKVAGSIEPFHMLPAHDKFQLTFNPAEDVTVYVASPVANVVAEVVCH